MKTKERVVERATTVFDELKKVLLGKKDDETDSELSERSKKASELMARHKELLWVLNMTNDPTAPNVN